MSVPKFDFAGIRNYDTISEGRGGCFDSQPGGSSKVMKEDKEDELQEAKELFKDGLRRILQATKKVSEKVVEGFREGYAQDVTKKEE